MSLVFTELYHNDFLVPDQSPLDPTNWHETSDDVLQIVSHICTTTVTDVGDGQALFNPSLPDDQYTEVTFNRLAHDDSSTIYAYLRGNLPFFSPCYLLQITGASTGLGYVLFISRINLASTPLFYDWVFEQPIALNVGDVLRLGVQGGVGGHIYFDLNGVNVFTGNLDNDPEPPILSGHACLQLGANPDGTVHDINDVGISRWAAGSTTGTPFRTEARVYGIRG